MNKILQAPVNAREVQSAAKVLNAMSIDDVYYECKPTGNEVDGRQTYKIVCRANNGDHEIGYTIATATTQKQILEWVQELVENHKREVKRVAELHAWAEEELADLSTDKHLPVFKSYAGGVTAVSKGYVETNLPEIGRVRQVIIEQPNKDEAEWYTEIKGEQGIIQVDGFSFGYMGEGSRAFAELLVNLGHHKAHEDWNIYNPCELDSTKLVYDFRADGEVTHYEM